MAVTLVERISNAYCYIDGPEVVTFDHTEANAKNSGLVERWNLCMQSKAVQIGIIHADKLNLPRLLVPGVNIQVRQTKANDNLSHEHGTH
jgi:hypothetical protein